MQWVHAACRTSPTGLTAATIIGKYVTVEPNCVLRSCRVQDYCLVGARSVLLEGSLMEPYSSLAPGSVLPPARRVPEGELWGGNPARFIRKLSGDEKDALKVGKVKVMSQNRAGFSKLATMYPQQAAERVCTCDHICLKIFLCVMAHAQRPSLYMISACA
jgi:carbonic anhydrase/acetyltransferase-like protein (isoleucine patch superfamily)